jgi:hypothetical protein
MVVRVEQVVWEAATVAWAAVMVGLEAVKVASGVATVESESEVGMVDQSPAIPGQVRAVRVVSVAWTAIPV